MEESAPKITTAGKWAQRLRGRSRMAVAAIGGVFLIGFMGVSRPLSARIDGAKDRLTKAEARMQLAGEVSGLRKQAALYQKKLPRGIDTNDWTNYLLTGIRGERVKLIRMDPKDVVTLGPCKVLSWQIDLEGDLESLGRVVEWLENGKRLVRIDRLLIQNPDDRLIMSLLVKGLALDVPPEQLKLEKEKAAKVQAAIAKGAKDKAKDREPAASWIDEASAPKLPADVKLPGGMKLPEGIRTALDKSNATASGGGGGPAITGGVRRR